MAEQAEPADRLGGLLERAHAALDIEDYAELADLLTEFDRRAQALAHPAAHATVDWTALAAAFEALQARIVIGRDEASAALRSLHGSRKRLDAYGQSPADDA